MGYSSIIRAFGGALIFLAVFMTAPLAIALTVGEKSADDYLFAAAITMFCGGALTVMGGADHKTEDFRGAILFILLWWIIAPIFAGLPFLLAGGTFFDAYFEAVSAMTTTGAWLSVEGARAELAGMFWRALLQWIGGLASLSIAAAIFIRPAFIGIDTLLPPFARGDKDSNIYALRRAAISFGGAYCLFTTGVAVVLASVGAPVWDSIVMALSVAASGGFIPDENGRLTGYSFAVIGALAPFIILSGANFVLLARAMRGGVGRNKDVETRVYVSAVILVGFVMWLAAGAGDLDLIPAQIFNAASLFSTNGVIIGEAPPLPLALVTVIIGGSAVSTAGGLKILRWLVIFSRIREEIRRLITPNGVFGKSNVANELGVWIHFLVFTMTLGVIILAISLGGHAFPVSSTAAIAALANAGPVIELAVADMAGAQFDGYAMFDAPVRAILCASMILGRLETVVALAIFNAAFWRS